MDFPVVFYVMEMSIITEIVIKSTQFLIMDFNSLGDVQRPKNKKDRTK